MSSFDPGTLFLLHYRRVYSDSDLDVRLNHNADIHTQTQISSTEPSAHGLLSTSWSPAAGWIERVGWAI